MVGVRKPAHATSTEFYALRPHAPGKAGAGGGVTETAESRWASKEDLSERAGTSWSEDEVPLKGVGSGVVVATRSDSGGALSPV